MIPLEDADGDGDDEVVYSRAVGFADFQRNRSFTLPGERDGPRFSAIVPQPVRFFAVDVGDFDGDGQRDWAGNEIDVAADLSAQVRPFVRFGNGDLTSTRIQQIGPVQVTNIFSLANARRGLHSLGDVDASGTCDLLKLSPLDSPRFASIEFLPEASRWIAPAGVIAKATDPASWNRGVPRADLD